MKYTHLDDIGCVYYYGPIVQSVPIPYLYGFVIRTYLHSFLQDVFVRSI